MAIIGHSEFIPVIWENCRKKFRMAIFGHSEFILVFLGKIARKNLEWPSFAIPSLYQSFCENCQKKFATAKNEFIAVFLGKIVGKIWNSHFWPFQLYTSLFGKNCQKKFGMAMKFVHFWIFTVKFKQIHTYPFHTV